MNKNHTIIIRFLSFMIRGFSNSDDKKHTKSSQLIFLLHYRLLRCLFARKF